MYKKEENLILIKNQKVKMTHKKPYSEAWEKLSVEDNIEEIITAWMNVAWKRNKRKNPVLKQHLKSVVEAA